MEKPFSMVLKGTDPEARPPGFELRPHHFLGQVA